MKNKRVSDTDPLDREIDFSNGRPNPYWLGVVDRQRVRLIDPDLAELFPNDDAVNEALRTVADGIRRTKKSKVSAKRATATRQRRSR